MMCLTACVQTCRHQYVEEITQQASCSTNGKSKSVCSQCGDVMEKIIRMTGHAYDEGKIIKKPSYSSTGTKQFICTLCGEQKEETIPKISITENGYRQGTHKCPDDIPEGEYILISDKDMGYFCISADPNGNKILDNDNFGSVSYVRIEKGTYLELSWCVAVPYTNEITFDIVNKGYISGTYKVGKDIPAGKYKLTAFSSGYYCIMDKPHGRIISNDFFTEGSCYIILKQGQYVTFSKVKINQA